MNSPVSIICSLAIFLFPYIGKKWFSRLTLASTVVSLGLLGTFGGIFAGLLDFDVNHIEIALPTLLEGLKTAFLTSIAGMCSSLLIRLCPMFYGIKQEEEQETEAEQIVALLSNIEKRLQTANETSNEHLMTLNTSFNLFAENISDLNANGISSALQKVMSTWDSQTSSQVNTILQDINHSVKNLEKLQNINPDEIKSIYTNLQTSLAQLSESSKNIEILLNNSTLSGKHQQDTIALQMNDLGNLVKSSEEHLGQKITNMEERFKHELSAMEKFSQTLVTIVNKLAQDHDTIKRQKEDF